MSLDIAAVQAALREDGLDGWLLYDFRGVNPVAARLTGVADSGHMATRRWYYLVPREGTPIRLVHAIERHGVVFNDEHDEAFSKRVLYIMRLMEP